MRPALKWTLLGVGFLIVGAQAVRPARTNPEIAPSQRIDAHLSVPRDVAALIDRSCSDCHSHSTRWPWYGQVAPVSWMVARHVKHGRAVLDFDAWGSYSAYEAQDLLDEIAEEVQESEMPLPVYLPLHPEAKLSEPERARLVEWARSERDRIRAAIDGGSGDRRSSDDRDAPH